MQMVASVSPPTRRELLNALMMLDAEDFSSVVSQDGLLGPRLDGVGGRSARALIVINHYESRDSFDNLTFIIAEINAKVLPKPKPTPSIRTDLASRLDALPASRLPTVIMRLGIDERDLPVATPRIKAAAIMQWVRDYNQSEQLHVLLVELSAQPTLAQQNAASMGINIGNISGDVVFGGTINTSQHAGGGIIHGDKIEQHGEAYCLTFLDEFPVSGPKLAEVRKVLTRAYSDTNRAKMLVKTVNGRMVAHINWNGSPVTVWFNILQEAARRGELRNLVTKAYRDASIRAHWPRLLVFLGY